MADVRTALLELLRAEDESAPREQLTELLTEVALGAARIEARAEPASFLAVARVLGRLVLDDAPTADVIDAAKAMAQRAPRDGKGNGVALLCGAVIHRLSQEPQLAEPYYRRVRRSEPGNPDVLAFYRQLFDSDQTATQLIQVLVQARRASKDPEVRFALAHEVADLGEKRLGSADRAIEIWRSVIREDGYDPRASAALERLYREGGKWTALVDLLKDELERIQDGDTANAERIEKLLEIASLYRERLNLDTMAKATLRRILQLDPRHEATLEALADTYAQAGEYNELLGVYSKRIEAAKESGETDRRIDLLRRVAEIWVERLGNPQRALEPLQEVLTLAPKDPGARGLLARIHEQRRDFRALIALRREDLEDKSGDDAMELRVELAKLAEDRLGDRREAIDAWNEVLAHHGDVDRALAHLARLYERESRWLGAAEILHRKLTYSNSEEAVKLLDHLGGLYTDRIQSRPDAVRVWLELLRLVPGHDKSIRRLRDAYVAQGQWDELTALFEGQGKLNDVVEVLQSAADRIGDIAERVVLYRRVAALCQDRLEQPERALKALERTLAIQPDNFDVARELLPIYREQSNWARLMSTYEVLLKAASGEHEQLELIAAMQEVAEDKLASPTLTQHWAAQGYRIRPTDASLRDGLEVAAERADGWDELTAIFEGRIQADGVSDDERLLLLDKLAVIARDRLFKPDDAQRYFRRIIALDPKNGQAMTALEDIYSATKRWDDLSEVYRKRLEVETDAGARLATLRSLAKIQEDQLGDLDAAVATYKAILDLSGKDADALQSLARIHRNRGNWAELADVLERGLELTASDGARTPLMFELSEIHATRLQNSDRAVAGFLAVLELEPNHAATVSALESLRQSDPSVSLPVMRGLLPYYRRMDDRPKEATAMEVIIAAEPAGEGKLKLMDQLAGTYEKMSERREDALRIRNELFRQTPEVWQGRSVLQRLGAELGRMAEVAAAYESVLVQMGNEASEAEQEGRTLSRERAGLRRDLLLEYAAMLRDALERPTDAERAYGEVLDRDETHQGAYDALEALLRARSANEELVALYRRRVDVTFNQREQKELLSRITDISRNVLGNRMTAVSTAEELLDLIPDDLATIELLAELYSEGEGNDEKAKLEEILGRQAELVDDPSLARRLRVQRAALRMQYLGDSFGAVDLLGQVLGEDPDDEEARVLLEELLAISEVQLQACALLEPIYGRLHDHEGRIRILHVRRGQAASQGATDEAVTHLIEIARIREYELGDSATAFDAMREAYLMDPRRSDTRQDVERLGVSLGRPAELADVWRRALSAGKVSDPALRIDLTTRLARLLDAHLRDQEAARQAYTDLLALNPPDVKLAEEAVQALCRLHLEAGDDIALVAAKRELLRFCDAPADQVRVRLEIAAIQEELLDRVGAALTYSEVLDLQQANVRALEALERLFFEENEWERLCEVLEHRISVTSDPRGRALLWRQIGETKRAKLGQPHEAVAAFQSVLDLKVGREETAYALQALVELNEALERWADVEEGLRRLTNIADNDEARVELLTRTALVVGRRLSRPQDSLDLLKRVLDLAPTDPRARSEVSGYLESDETRERSVRILTPLYEAEQNWAALLELEELQARKQPSGRRRLQALLKVARTQEERIGDPEKAFAVLCEAMAEAADQPELEDILEKVERLGAEPDRAEALLGAYTETVDRILDSALQARVLRAQGGVALERLGRLEDARKAFARLLELGPDDHAAADALEQIYLRKDDHGPLAELLVARADRVSEDPQRDEHLVRAAEIYRSHLAQPQDAIRLYERLSADALARPQIQDVLEPLYEQTERFRELAAHLNRKLVRLTGKEAVDTHLRLGRLYGERLDDPEEGIRHMSAALRLDPDHAVATEELDRYLEDPAMRGRVAEMLEPVFAAVADWTRLIQIQEIRLAEAPDDEARMAIMLRVAQIEEEQLEDLERAMGSYTRLFREQPSRRHVRDQLSRLAGVLEQSDRYAELLTEYVQSEGASDDGDDMLAIVREAADLWSGSLRQPARAVPLLRRILAARPEDTAVFAAMEAAMTQAEMWRDLGDAYWREADTALNEDRQIELLRKLATLSQELLEDPEQAAKAYQRMIEIRPDYELARSRLEQIFTETNRHADLLELLRERMTRTEPAVARNEIGARVAQLQDGPLEDPDGAVDTLETMLADVPDDPRAVALLEHVAQARRDFRPRILAILRPIYERTDNVRRMVEIDEWQLGHTDDPVTRHELFREMAALLGRSSETAEAGFRTLCRALSEPGPVDALEALDAEVERVADVLDQRGALAEALVAAAASEALQSDSDRRLSLLVRGAAKQSELGDAARAVETLREALELRDDHEPGLRLLDTALTKLGYHDELSGVLRRRADVSTDDTERVELLRRLATLLEEVLVRPEEAESVWKGLLDIEPNDREALRRLSRSYERAGSTKELIEVLERQIDAAADPQERRDLRMQLANLHRETHKDREAEIDVLRSLLSEAPSDDDALAALSRALSAEERNAEAADVLQERATLATTDERRAALVLDAARLFRGPLEDVPSALERYESILQLMPGHEAALADLAELAKSPDHFEAAGTLAIPQLESVGRFGELAEALQARATLSLEPEERGDALRRLARVQIERLDDHGGALASYNALLEVANTDELAEVLEAGGRLAVQLGQGTPHVEMLAERAASVDREPAERVAVAMYAANLAEEILGEPKRALDILVPLVEAGLATLAVCERVERLGRSGGRTEAVELALREVTRMSDEAQSQSSALCRLGEVQLDLGKLGPALDSFRDAFDLTGDLAALRGLESVLEHSSGAPAIGLLDALEAAYQSTSDRAGQARVTELRLKAADAGDRGRYLEQLATLRDEGGGSPEEALEAWGELLTMDPDSAQALERVMTIGRGSGRLPRAVELMLAGVEAAREAGNQAHALALTAAGILLRDLSDAGAALTTVKTVLEDQPEHPEALDLWVSAARQAGDAEVLHGALVRSAGAQPAPDTAANLWSEAAAVAESALGNPQTAIDDLEQLLSLDESDGRAWQKLLALLTAAADYDKLVEALGRRASITDSVDERRELRYRLANVLVDKVERPEDAATVYQDMLGDKPDDREAMQELEVLLRRLEKWEEVRDVLERKLEASDGDQRALVLEELAQLAENRLDDPVDAIERYQQIVAEQPGHNAAEAALERLLTAEERWVDLSELLQARMRRYKDGGEGGAYRATASQLAALLAEKLEHPERAQEILKELLEDDQSYIPAILALASVYEVRGDEGAMRLMLQRAVDLDPDGRDGAQLYLRLARVNKGDADKRREHLEKALDLDPANVDVAGELLDLCRNLERWDQVAYMLELLAGRVEDNDAKRKVTLERVDVLLERLRDAEGALRVLAPVYKDVQDDIEVNRRIADALFAAERLDEAAGMYNWLVEVGRRAKRSKALAHHLTRLARISLREDTTKNGAKDNLLEAYRIDTTNVETLMTLGEVYERDAEWKEALKIYRTMLLQNADQSGLLRRGDIYINLARAHLALEEKPKARAMLRRGLEEDGDHPEIGPQLASLDE